LMNGMRKEEGNERGCIGLTITECEFV